MKRRGLASLKSTRMLAACLILSGLASTARSEAPASGTAKQPATDVCVDVKIGNDRSRYYDCLNGQMRQQAAHQANQQAVTQDAVSNSQPHSPTQMGLYNQAATRERLGSSFGHSVVPQRPQQKFVNPLVH